MRPVLALVALTVLTSSRPSRAGEDKPAAAVRKLLKRKKVPDAASLTINSAPPELSDADVTAPFWFVSAEASDGKPDKPASSYYAAYDSSHRRAYYKNKWAFSLFVRAAGVPKDPKKKLSAVQLASAWWVLTLGTAPSWRGDPKLVTEADGTLVVTATTAARRARVLEIRITPKGKVSVKSRRE